MICNAMIDKPKKIASRLGTFGEVFYTLSPKSADIVLNTAYNLFPDSKAARGKKQLPAGDGATATEEKEEQMSTEAVAMAYLMRGVHF